jgi:hypothetical protein
VIAVFPVSGSRPESMTLSRPICVGAVAGEGVTTMSLGAPQQGHRDASAFVAAPYGACVLRWHSVAARYFGRSMISGLH